MEILVYTLGVGVFGIIAYTFVHLPLYFPPKRILNISTENLEPNSPEAREMEIENRYMSERTRQNLRRYYKRSIARSMLVLVVAGFLWSVVAYLVPDFETSFGLAILSLLMFAVFMWQFHQLPHHLHPFDFLQIMQLTQKGDYAGVKTILDTAPLDIYPGISIIIILTYQSMGELERAKQFAYAGLEQLRARPPEHQNKTLQGEILALLGNINALEGDHHKAIEICEDALRHSSSVTYAHKQIAESMLYLDEDLAKIETHIEQSLAHVPPEERDNIPPTNLHRAWMLAKQGQVEQAQAIIQRVLGEIDREHIPDTSEILVLAGHVELALGHQEAARNYFQEALEIDPDGLPKITAQRGLAQAN